MKIGDLVRMRSRSLEGIYGFGIIVRQLRSTAESPGAPAFQVFWSKYGLGRRVAAHSLEKVSEFKEG